MQKKKEAQSEESYGELGQAFNFTAGDLEANRQGFLTHRQAKLQRNGALRLSLFLIGVACLIVISYGAIIYFKGQRFDFFIFATALVPIGFIVTAFFNLLIVNRDIRKRRVQSAICRKEERGTYGGYYFLLQIDLPSKLYYLSPYQYNLLHSFNYRIYYLPRSHQSSHQILSIEEAPNETLTP